MYILYLFYIGSLYIYFDSGIILCLGGTNNIVLQFQTLNHIMSGNNSDSLFTTEPYKQNSNGTLLEYFIEKGWLKV